MPKEAINKGIWDRLTLKTAKSGITILVAKTAMIIVDMQNCFMCKALYPDNDEPYKAMRVLLQTGILAVREAGIQIIWLNWGFADEEMKNLLPHLDCIFCCDIDDNYLPMKGIGRDIGCIDLEPGEVLEPNTCRGWDSSTM